MKTREKDYENKVTELCEMMDGNGEYIFFSKEDDCVRIALPSGNGGITDTDVSVVVASVLDAYLSGSSNEGVSRLSEIIIKAMEFILACDSETSSRLSLRLSRALLFRLKNKIEELKDEKESGKHKGSGRRVGKRNAPKRDEKECEHNIDLN